MKSVRWLLPLSLLAMLAASSTQAAERYARAVRGAYDQSAYDRPAGYQQSAAYQQEGYQARPVARQQPEQDAEPEPLPPPGPAYDDSHYLDERAYQQTPVYQQNHQEPDYSAYGTYGTYNWGYGDTGQYNGGSKYPTNPYFYDRWRPWWGGLCGWGPFHGASGYPAYRCKHTSGYFFRPCMYPPRSYYYGFPAYEGGYAQYPRNFVYDWDPEEGDTSPRAE